MNILGHMAVALAMMGGGGTADDSSGWIRMLVPMAIIFALFYFMIIRPQKAKEKERKAMIDAVKSGDKIIFGAGIIGVVSNVKKGTITVKVGDKTKMEILRAAVVKVVDKNDDLGDGLDMKN
jgi:preprotein translocase subunit YajC